MGWTGIVIGEMIYYNGFDYVYLIVFGFITWGIAVIGFS